MVDLQKREEGINVRSNRTQKGKGGIPPSPFATTSLSRKAKGDLRGGIARYKFEAEKQILGGPNPSLKAGVPLYPMT